MSRPIIIGPSPRSERREEIRAAVAACGGNQAAAARLLGVSPGTVWAALNYGAKDRAKGRAYSRSSAEYRHATRRVYPVGQ